MTRAMTATPPTTPPAIAPTGVEEAGEVAIEELGVADADGLVSDAEAEVKGSDTVNAIDLLADDALVAISPKLQLRLLQTYSTENYSPGQQRRL